MTILSGGWQTLGFYIGVELGGGGYGNKWAATFIMQGVWLPVLRVHLTPCVYWNFSPTLALASNHSSIWVQGATIGASQEKPLLGSYVQQY